MRRDADDAVPNGAKTRRVGALAGERRWQGRTRRRWVIVVVS